MLLNGNQIYTLVCETQRHNMLVASDDYEEVISEAMVLCRATNEEVKIFCHGTGYVQGNITPKFIKALDHQCQILDRVNEHKLFIQS